jgi:hypothetical protein
LIHPLSFTGLSKYTGNIMPAPSGSRFHSLQKRLERRNNSLKPSYNPSNRLDDHLPLTKEERQVQPSKSREIVPGLIPSTDTCSTDQGSRGELEEIEAENPLRETLIDPLIERMRQIIPSTMGYLPVAMPRSKERMNNTSDSNQRVDAEQAYLNLFNAPSHIELREKATFDDGVTEVSEITTDVRALSTKGAFYCESRLAGKLQQRLEKSRSTGRTLARSGSPGQHNLSLSQSHSYVEVDVNDLRHLNEAVEKAKIDLQRAMTPVNVDVRHGLPYDATDFRAEGDDEESDIWDGAILDSYGQHQQQIHSSLDPVDGKVLCVQGPPTPRERVSPEARSKSEHLQNLIVETLSSEGDIVIDTTEIRDEDLDGVVVLDGDGKNINEATAEASVLFGEQLVLESAVGPDEAGLGAVENAVGFHPDQTTPTRRSPKKSPKKSKVKRISRSRSQNSDVFKSKSPKALDEVRSELQDAAVYDRLHVKEGESATVGFTSSHEQHYIQNKNDARGDHCSVFVQPDHQNCDSTTRDVTAMATDLYSSSLGYFKSFVGQVDAQLRYIQRRGLIDENEMDGMLNVLDQEIHETSKNLPDKSDEAVILLGEEIERTTCGIDRSIGNHGREIDFPTESVENMLDTLKNTYQRSLKTCGVDRTMIEENTRAMEKMVSSLKLSYHKNAVACGKREDIVEACGSKSDIFSEADKLVWDFPASGPNSGAILPSVKPRNSLLGDLSLRGHRSKSSGLNGVSPGVGLKTQDKREGDVAHGRELRQKSAEAVEEMLSSTKELDVPKVTKIRTRRRRNAPFREPQTFIVPINMPMKDAPPSSAYSSIE